MARRILLDEDEMYGLREDDDIRPRLRHFKKDREPEPNKTWDRENKYDSDHDYDERR